MNSLIAATPRIARFSLAMIACLAGVTSFALPSSAASKHLNTSIAAQPDSPIRIDSCLAMIVLNQGNEEIAYSIAFTNVTSKTIQRIVYALTINPESPNAVRATKTMVGTFSPSVPIDAHYAGAAAGVTGPAAATTPNVFPHIDVAQCSIVSVRFDDKTAWNAPALGSRPLVSLPSRTPAPPGTTPTPDPAVNRVGITYPLQSRGLQNNVNFANFNQLMSDYSGTSDFTPVGMEDGITLEQARNLQSVCETKHVHAVIYVLGGGDVGGNRSEVGLLFRAIDCSGATIFGNYRSRAVNTVWSLKSAEKIAKDISSGLLTDLEKDFAAFLKDNQGLWSSVLYTGVPIDPKTSAYISLLSFYQSPSKAGVAWSVSHVFSGGPADLAGVHVGDAIVSVDGSALTSSMTAADVDALTNKSSYKLGVRRSGTMLSIEVKPLHYADLLRSLGEQAPPAPK